MKNLLLFLTLALMSLTSCSKGDVCGDKIGKNWVATEYVNGPNGMVEIELERGTFKCNEAPLDLTRILEDKYNSNCNPTTGDNCRTIHLRY